MKVQPILLWIVMAAVLGSAHADAMTCAEAEASISHLVAVDSEAPNSLQEVESLYSKLRSMTPPQQRAVAIDSTPEVLSSVWRLHFSRSLEQHSLSDAQCEVIWEIAQKLSPSAYSEEAAQELRSEIEELYLVSQVLFAADVHQEIFVNMGVKPDPSADKDRICEALTNERLRTLVCSNVATGAAERSVD